MLKCGRVKKITKTHKKNGGEVPMFLTGIADVWCSLDVTRTIAYGFKFDTQTLSEIISNLFGFLGF